MDMSDYFETDAWKWRLGYVVCFLILLVPGLYFEDSDWKQGIGFLILLSALFTWWIATRKWEAFGFLFLGILFLAMGGGCWLVLSVFCRLCFGWWLCLAGAGLVPPLVLALAAR